MNIKISMKCEHDFVQNFASHVEWNQGGLHTELHFKQFFFYLKWIEEWNYVNPGYFSLAATALKPQQIPMFLHISARVWGRRWSPHTSEQKGSM